MNPTNRRQALKTIAAASASALLAQDAPIQIAGRPIEITLTSVTPQTVRITVQPIENGQPLPVPHDGALVKEDCPAHRRLARITLPIWLYVAASGWIVYYMLYRMQF